MAFKIRPGLRKSSPIKSEVHAKGKIPSSCPTNLLQAAEFWVAQSRVERLNPAVGRIVLTRQANPTRQIQNMFNLCGPGAVDNVLYYWNTKSNNYGRNSLVNDHITTTTWDDYDNRAYMFYLAWQMQPAGLGWQPGMMDSTHTPSWGVSLWDVRDGLNWEASGHNASGYTNFYYYIEWHNATNWSESNFLNNVVNDTWNDSRPVEAEVNARLMPNWANNGLKTNHAIAIIGYDYHAIAKDGNRGVLYYLDSCGQGTGTSATGCGALQQQQVEKASMYQTWAAINSVDFDPSTAPGHGDGGYIW